MEQIITRLYLGSFPGAKQWLQEHPDVPKDALFVVNCTKDFPDLASNCIRIFVSDDGEKTSMQIMFNAFPLVIKRIHEALTTGKYVLCHCAMGQQRSAAVVAAYLMWCYYYTPQEAINVVRAIRKEAFLYKANFLPSLEAWYDALRAANYSLDAIKPVHS